MGLWYILNCAALCYSPMYLAYRFTKLSEFGAWPKCLYAGGIYLLTAAFKLMVLGSLFPTAFSSEGASLSFFQAILRFFIGLCDVVALGYVVTQTSRDLKILVPGVGWVAIKALAEYFVGFLVAVRASNFEWKYLQWSIDANIDLLHYVTLASLLFIYTRKDLLAELLPLVLGLILLSRMDEILFKLLVSTAYLPSSSWLKLTTRLALNGVVAVATHGLLNSRALGTKRS